MNGAPEFESNISPEMQDCLREIAQSMRESIEALIANVVMDSETAWTADWLNGLH